MHRVCSLFSGIGGFEVGFSKAGFKTVLMCESDPIARAVLKRRFPSIPIRRDVRNMASLPACEVLVAGWPCQDLSQAGKTAGMAGDQSSLVSEVFRLIAASKRKPDYVVLENVPFALHLKQGVAVAYVTRHLEKLGYSWSYRILDTRHFGLPQRRRRLFILACRHRNPESLLFDGVASSVEPARLASMFGFYWTEGNTGIGWSPDAIPPLKGGSGLSIPSPPAIWDRSRATFLVPGIGDAERMQGFRQGWTTTIDQDPSSARFRWRLVGNAVSVPVAEWIAKRIASESKWNEETLQRGIEIRRANFAYGGPDKVVQRHHIAEGPRSPSYAVLSDFSLRQATALSQRAAKGFLSRLRRSTLKTDPQFIRDLAAYVS